LHKPDITTNNAEDYITDQLSSIEIKMYLGEKNSSLCRNRSFWMGYLTALHSMLEEFLQCSAQSASWSFVLFSPRL